MTLRAKVAHGLKWQAVMIAGRQLLSLVIFGLLARLLEPADFGLMGLTYVYLQLAGMLTDQGLGTALIQRPNPERRHWDTAFIFNIGCAVLLCAGTIVFAHPLADLLGEPRLAPILCWSSVSMLFSAAAVVPGTIFTKEMDFRRPALRTLLAHLTGGVVGVGMALSQCGVWSLVGQQIVTALVGMIFIWSVSTYKPAFQFSFRHLRDLFAVSSPVFINTLIWFLLSRLDQLVIGRVAGANTLGLYVVAGKIPELAKVATHQPVAEVSMPALSKLHNDLHRMREAIYHGMALNAMVMFAVFVGLATVAQDLLPLLLGSKWTAASNLCSLLSLYALIASLQVFIFPALLVSGIRVVYALLGVANAAGVLLASLVGIQFGTEYVVVGLIANSVIQAVPCLILLRRQISLSLLEYCRPCLAPACASVFMAAAIQVAHYTFTAGMSPWLRLTIHVTIGALAYLGFLHVFSRSVLRELLQLLNHTLRTSRSTCSPPSP